MLELIHFTLVVHVFVQALFVFLCNTLSHLVSPYLLNALLFRIFLVGILRVLIKVILKLLIYLILSVWKDLARQRFIITELVIYASFILNVRTSRNRFRLWLTKAKARSILSEVLRSLLSRILISIHFDVHGLYIADRTRIVPLEWVVLIIVVIDSAPSRVQCQL